MSEPKVDESPNGDQLPSNEVKNNQTTDNQDDFVQRDTHMRVLSESKKYKQRAIEAEARAKSLEEAKLTEQQQYKELAERYKKENESLKSNYTELQLRSQLIPKLVSSGVRDVEDAMKLGNTDVLMHDPDSDSLLGVEDFVKDLKTRKPWLFDSGKPSSVNSSLPASDLNRPTATRKEDLNSLSRDEIMKRLKSGQFRQ